MVLKSNGSWNIIFHKMLRISTIGCQISSKCAQLNLLGDGCERQYHALLPELLISSTFGLVIVEPILCIRSFVLNHHVVYANFLIKKHSM